ncbi:MAG: gamma carbonic anhydrase family protein [Negativicutes bacterium]|nr:gamma carbonic anhydrase family protein [Negativicutes bacterium]
MIPGRQLPYKGRAPQLGEAVFLAEGCLIIGSVDLGSGSSVWFNTVIRGDENTIKIGAYTNIQEGCIIHVQPEHYPVVIGDYVTVGHNAVIHGCTIADNCLVGMGAIVMNGARIGANCILGAGTLIPENRVVPANSLVAGSPGRVLRAVTPEQIEMIRRSAVHYHELAMSYPSANEREGT